MVTQALRGGVRLVAILAGLLVMPTVAVAQDIIPGWSSLGFSALRSLTGSAGCGKFGIRPLAEVGYQRLRFDVGFPDSRTSSGWPAPLGFEMPGAGMWVGGLGLELGCAQRLSVAAKYRASLGKNVEVHTPDHPMDNVLSTVGRRPYEWTGSHFQWSTLDVAGSWAVSQGVSLVAGVRREQVSMGVDDPRDRNGNAVDYSFVPLPPGTFFSYAAFQEVESDFSVKLLCPYLGLTLAGAQYRFSINWSPAARAQVTIPMSGFSRIDALGGPLVVLRGEVTGDFRYALRKPGGMLSSEFSYDVIIRDRGLLNFWLAAAWADIRSTGTAASDITSTFQVFPPIGARSSVTREGTDTSAAELTWSRVSGGVCAVLQF